MSAYKITAFADKHTVQAALVAHEDAWNWDPEIVLSGCEIAEDKPGDWQLDAWLDRKPNAADKKAVRALFAGGAPKLTTEKLPDADWLKLSQEGVDPIRAGRFYVRTPDHPPPPDVSLIDFVIPASQAFGTGQHQTTAGCLAMLDLMRASGVSARNVADIGTGTGLLGFAALKLWPGAFATLSDIDAVCVDVVASNARANMVRMGGRRGEAVMIVADGMDDALLQARGPYDVLLANILAGPLIDLAPAFGASVPAGGHLVLAGLLEEQEAAVRRAMMRSGFRLSHRLVNGDWSILWLRKRGLPG